MEQSIPALQALEALESRLAKLELFICGDQNKAPAEDSVSGGVSGIAIRLQGLEKALERLEAQSDSLRALLRLNRQRAPAASRGGDFAVDPGDEAIAAATVLSHSDRYREVASHLRSMEDMPVPDAASCVHLVAQNPRLMQAWSKVQLHEEQISSLRDESAELVARWHAIGVLGVGDVVSEWDSRLTDVALAVRQAQARRRREASEA